MLPKSSLTSSPPSRRRALQALAALGGACLSQHGRAEAAPGPQRMPGRMLQQRFVIEITGADGQPARLFTSTAASLQVTASGGLRLGASPPDIRDSRERRAATRLTWGRVVPDPRVPPPVDADDSFTMALQQGDPSDDTLQAGAIAVLGAAWFADRHWQWDPAAGTLTLLPDASPLPGKPEQQLALGFRRGAPPLPRLTVAVDGEPLSALLDTGASVLPTPTARARLGVGADAVMGTSFITASRAQAWHQRHPDWPWLPAADSLTGDAMLCVPSVALAGQASGPVWFTVRPDENFGPQGLSAFSDLPVQAALGGSLLQGFTLNLDYLRARAVFIKN